MKVLYLVSLFPCWSETFIVRELHALKEQGIDVEIFSLKRHGEAMVHDDAKALLSRTFYPSKLPLLIVRALWMFFRRPWVNSRLLVKIIGGMTPYTVSLLKSLVTFLLALDAAFTIKRKNPDRLHAHWATYPSTAAWVISKNLDIPFGFTCHAHDIFLENHLLEHKAADANLCVTISKFNIRFLQDVIGASANEKFQVVHCGVDVEDFEFRSSDTSSKIVSVGRFDEIKGFKYLIEACRILKDKAIPFSCEIVGEGPLRQAIEKQIKDSELSDFVNLTGAMKQEEVRQFISEGTVFCLPSVKTSEGNMDGIPVVLMEAMALGTPVISTRVSGIPELVIEGETGRLCEPENPGDLAEVLEEHLNNSALRKQLATAARDKVESEFDCNLEAQKLGQYFGHAS